MADIPTDSTTGTIREGSADVPVVDITALVQQLYEEADIARERRALMLLMAKSAERQADYLEQLAATLAGEIPR